MTGALCALGCAGPTERELAATRALEYLETTTDETGLDVVLATTIYAERRDDAYARRVVDVMLTRVRPVELERYGALLETDRSVFPRGSLDGVVVSTSTPDPADDWIDGDIGECLDEALSCSVTDACRDFVALEDRWGYVLTHQAVWLLFARWTGCESGVDLEARRRVFAANLVRAMEHDPAPSDLAYERMAMIAHLGFADALEPAWVDALVDAQQPDGSFEVVPGSGGHPHPTGVALWVLALAPDE